MTGVLAWGAPRVRDPERGHVKMEEKTEGCGLPARES